MIIDEVTTVAALALVEVGFGDGLVREKLVLGKFEDEAETRLVEVLHANINEVLQGGLITVGNHLGKRNLVLHGRQPELGDTRDVG